MIVYHGSDHIVKKPNYMGGKDDNDYGNGFYTTEYEDHGVRIFGEDSIRIFYECVMFKTGECSGMTVFYRPFSLGKDLETRVYEGVISSIVLP